MASKYQAGHLRFEFDPFEKFPRLGNKVPDDNKKQAQREISDFILDAVLDIVGGAKSPVKGEGWKQSLSTEYKEFKKTQSSSSKANMELKGDMLDALKSHPGKGSNVVLEIKGKQAEKADGHNKLTGRSNKNPKRRFIPGKGQEFKDSINSGIRAILREFAEEDE